MSESSSVAKTRKVCIKCAKDVSNAKRMKGSKGEYWCYDCGTKDQMSKGGGILTPCADCGKPCPPTSLYRRDGEYVCSTCSRKEPKTGMFGGGGGGAPPSPEARSARMKLIACLCIMAVALPMLVLGYFDMLW